MSGTRTQNNNWVEFEPLSLRERFGITLIFLGSIAGSILLTWMVLRGFFPG